MDSLPFIGAAVFAGGALIGLLVSYVVGRLRTDQSIFHARLQSEEIQKQAREIRDQAERLEQLETDELRLETETALRQRNFNEQVEQLTQLRSQVGDRLSSIVRQALEDGQTKMTEATRRALEGRDRSIEAEQAQRDAAVRGLVQPVSDMLARLDARIVAMESDRRQSLGAIAVHLEQIARVHADVRDETQRLANALETTPGTYGSWAEQQLQSVLEMAGMTAHIDQQRSNEPVGSDRLRPTAILRLPGDRRLAIDANLPNTSFRAVVDADEETEAQALADHAGAVRQHMERLAAPEYWAGLTPTPEFVVLYFSGESPFAAALQSDPDLFGDAVRRRVLLATPTTLIALAKAIAHSWSQDKSVANAREVMAFGSELYEKVITLSEQVDELGRSLEANVRTYNSLAGDMQTVVLPNARRFRDMAPELAKGEPTPSEPVDLAMRSAQRRRSFVLTQGGQDAVISIIAGPTAAVAPKAPQGTAPAKTDEPALRRTISSIDPF